MISPKLCSGFPEPKNSSGIEIYRVPDRTQGDRRFWEILAARLKIEAEKHPKMARIYHF
jgi:hypothetical protein